MAKEKTYSDKLKDPRWQKKRLEVLQRDNFTCQLCSDAETELHIHHKTYSKGHQPWEYDLSNFITYCKHCHSAVEYISSKYEREFVKAHKKVCDNGFVLLLIRLAKIGKPSVAVCSFDESDILELHIILGPRAISEMVILRDLIP